MKKLTAAQIRQMYLDFFKEKGHSIEPSASLVPVEDPTLLWINSGVATLKKYFDGRVIPENPRITNSQKSIRTNDIENVGKTARHHTFFEMLGNFSIGDYFREEAVTWGWELLTSSEWFGFEKEKLFVTVYPEDKETYDLWIKLGLDPEHIILLEGNFWEIGEGPCGPCTEIFYDRGTKYDPENIGIKLLKEDLENDRYLEIWNIVFSQFNSKDGLDRKEYPELPNKNIDTGMGLERMASVLQEVDTNFDTDLFMPIINVVETISGQKYRNGQLDQDTAFKVIADHIRTVSFAVADGALPSNEGRGYVLRRLIRRAVRFAKKLGIERPFMFELVPVVAEIMESYYPNVKEKVPFIQKVIKNEEERFHETLHEGLSLLTNVMKDAKAKGSSVIKGEDVFRLYDTYGFPIELTEEYAEEEGLTVDHDGFEVEMEKQRERARSARQDVDSMQVQSEALREIKETSAFVGYSEGSVESTVLVLVQDGEKVEDVANGEEAHLILDVTPFYAESGGQIADRGTLTAPGLKVEVLDVQKAPNGQNLHRVKVVEGALSVGAKVESTINKANRSSIVKNHTATHLLHQALKDVLGTHVNQAGSLVNQERLRFDFSHFGQVTSEELEIIEKIVNEKIWESIPVQISEKAIAEAKAMGAMALFGEKYGDVVRVVQVGDYSLELCGGCHVDNTASIGTFKIISESGIGAGTRRIEAVTGKSAYEYMQEQIGQLKEAASLLKSNTKDVVTRIETLQSDLKQVQKENDSLSSKLSNIEAGNISNNVKEVNGVKFVAAKVNGADMNSLRTMVDDLKNKIGSVVVLLGSANEGKVNLIAGVTKDLVGQGYHAGNLIKEAASICGGGGGGRPDMAQAGGKDPSKLDEAVAFVEKWMNTISK
ncbi:alanine--tRNA ligase [Bacillus sp. AFS088145]|uniref:alanine--tRNA ligase n=1 Tax=Bacillus sp. AFS088145 TaxID=2033514 RepID=UPI000BF7ED82|nr:alanine--tRNA ligase [Bacillus sp. AFS088145]PFH86322.1 alanine--tRNA ligase [Bacillus sp. AFS088145]